MGKNFLFTLAAIACFVFSAQAWGTATSETVTFTVYGNCGMCERAIEGAVKNEKGISFADWDRETHQMKVDFNPSVVTLGAIRQMIADAGYDSDTHRADDRKYDSLPACCKYTRPNN